MNKSVLHFGHCALRYLRVPLPHDSREVLRGLSDHLDTTSKRALQGLIVEERFPADFAAGLCQLPRLVLDVAKILSLRS